MINDKNPNRDLDVAVARIMGINALVTADGDAGFHDLIHDSIWKQIPYYSAPMTEYDETGIITMILWLQARGVVVTDRRNDSTMVEFRPTPTDAEAQTVCITRIVDDEPLRAMALALCQCVLSARPTD